jgi:(heptosyl)LPS beta-1,4-glucosyltransferase
VTIALLASERIPISVVIPTLNEAPRLRAALETVSWADEVIVVDAGSDDGTPSIARRHGARVLTVTGQTIGEQRNAGIANARNHWILALDADEQVTPELRASLAQLCYSLDRSPRAYRIRSRNWHLGRELRHGPWGRDWKVRVFSRDQRFSSAKVHENIEGLDEVGALDGALIHRPYRDLAHQVTKIAKYAKWAAEDMRARGRRASLVDLLFRPWWRFVRDYLFYSGWRDGRAGFVVATVSAFSVFLKYACLLLPGEPSDAAASG